MNNTAPEGSPRRSRYKKEPRYVIQKLSEETFSAAVRDSRTFHFNTSTAPNRQGILRPEMLAQFKEIALPEVPQISPKANPCQMLVAVLENDLPRRPHNSQLGRLYSAQVLAKLVRDEYPGLVPENHPLGFLVSNMDDLRKARTKARMDCEVTHKVIELFHKILSSFTASAEQDRLVELFVVYNAFTLFCAGIQRAQKHDFADVKKTLLDIQKGVFTEKDKNYVGFYREWVSAPPGEADQKIPWRARGVLAPVFKKFKEVVEQGGASFLQQEMTRILAQCPWLSRGK